MKNLSSLSPEEITVLKEFGIWFFTIFLIVVGIITTIIYRRLSRKDLDNEKPSTKIKKRSSTSKFRLKGLLFILFILFSHVNLFAQNHVSILVSQEEIDQFVAEGYFIRHYPEGENILDNEQLMKEFLDLEVGFNAAVDQDSFLVLKQAITQAKEMYMEGVFNSGYDFMTTKEDVGVLEYDMRQDEDVNDFFTMIFNRSEIKILYIKEDNSSLCIIRPGGVFPYIGDIGRLSLLTNGKFLNFIVWLEQSYKLE